MKTIAIDELAELSEALDDPSSGSLGAAIQRVSEAATRYVEAESPTARNFMEWMLELLQRVPGVEHAEHRIEALLSGAHHFYLLGSPLVGAVYAAEAVDLARRSGVLLRRALAFQGMMYADTGNIPSAIECFAEGIDLARAQKDTVGECSVWINLGVAFLYSAQFRDAIACCERVMELLGGMASTTLTQTIFGKAAANIALCCIHTGETERGLGAAQSALQSVAEPRNRPDLMSRVLRETYYTRLLLAAGEIEEAGEHAAMGLRYASQSGSSRAQIPADMAQGLYEVYAGRAAAGLSRLKHAVARGRAELPSMVRDTLGALVQSYEFLGQPREALVYLEELMDVTRKWQQDNALEHVRQHLQLGGIGERESAVSSRIRKQEAQLRGDAAAQEMFRSPSEMLERLAVTAELREDTTGEHCYRLGKLAALLARESGSDAATCQRIELAARLHDIGKNAIPDSIILKRGKLTEAERQIMHAHSAAGADLIAGSGIPQMEMAEQVARHHHDWWDGSQGRQRGNDIPHAARLVALADVFDALTHERPHRAPWSVRETLEAIRRLKGRQFDPGLTDLFIAMVERLGREHRDLDAFLGGSAKASPFLQARARIKDALQNTQ